MDSVLAHGRINFYSLTLYYFQHPAIYNDRLGLIYLNVIAILRFHQSIIKNRWLLTAAARVRSRVWSSGICGGQSGANLHSTNCSTITLT
jgi:hypothetical protein